MSVRPSRAVCWVLLRANERLASTSSARMPVSAIVVIRLDAGLGAARRRRLDDRIAECDIRVQLQRRGLVPGLLAHHEPDGDLRDVDAAGRPSGSRGAPCPSAIDRGEGGGRAVLQLVDEHLAVA